MYEDVSTLDYFRSLVANPKQIPLVEAAASLAQDAYPNLDLQEVLFEVDVLCQRLAKHCRQTTLEKDRLEVMTTFFYRKLGFAGNVNNYYDPDNSFIHRVIETRCGIPITLAVLYIELARNIGLEAHGVSFPSHFLVKVNLHEGTAIIDPFTGTSLSMEDIEERLEPFRAELPESKQHQLPAELFLREAPDKEILLRMLRNLHEIYRRLGKTDQLEAIQTRAEILEDSI